MAPSRNPITPPREDVQSSLEEFSEEPAELTDDPAESSSQDTSCLEGSSEGRGSCSVGSFGSAVTVEVIVVGTTLVSVLVPPGTATVEVSVVGTSLVTVSYTHLTLPTKA